MNIFAYAGRLAAPVELRKNGDTSVARFRLIRNEYAGKDDNGNAKERTVSIQFAAFNRRAEAIAANAMVGDQLIVYATVKNNNWTDAEGKDRYEYNFEIEDWEFGAPGQAKREKMAEQKDG